MHANNAMRHAHVIPTTTFQFGFIKFILRNAKLLHVFIKLFIVIINCLLINY